MFYEKAPTIHLKTSHHHKNDLNSHFVSIILIQPPGPQEDRRKGCVLNKLKKE